MDVVLTYRSNRAEAENAIATIKELGHKAVALPLDTSNVSSFDGFVRDFGTALRETWGRERFDFLVNNAGTAVHAPSPKRRKRTSTTWSTFISKACSS